MNEKRLQQSVIKMKAFYNQWRKNGRNVEIQPQIVKAVRETGIYHFDLHLGCTTLTASRYSACCLHADVRQYPCPQPLLRGPWEVAHERAPAVPAPKPWPRCHAEPRRSCHGEADCSYTKPTYFWLLQAQLHLYLLRWHFRMKRLQHPLSRWRT